MSLILLFARLLLASVFLLAGLAKLGDLAGSRQAVTAFGVPERLARPMGTVLPFIELAAGMALIPSATARFGALLALALLVVFAGAIALALANGREPDCHCFGQLRSAPASWRTLLRDAGLAAVAAFVLAAGWSNTGASATGWIGALGATAAVGLLGGGVILVVLCFLGWFSLQLLRQHGRLPARIELLENGLACPQQPRMVMAGPRMAARLA